MKKLLGFIMAPNLINHLWGVAWLAIDPFTTVYIYPKDLIGVS